ncbi:MAG: TetR/AcrR family transcriptional regulator [Clostridiales bacterium]|nr:TetR/AcrR family transcriptional regulator [Clostridiales bacterium]
MGGVRKDKEERTIALLEKCFDCFCENGLEDTGMKKLAAACDISGGNFFNTYFRTKDEIVIRATAHCMTKVEDDFMSRAPQSMDEVEQFIREMPYITEREHGKKYRFMYQVYCSPKYREQGEEFFDGATKRYAEYAAKLAPKLGMPQEVITPLIFIFVRACVHYAMFRNEDYLKPQIELILMMIGELKEKYSIQGDNKT